MSNEDYELGRTYNKNWKKNRSRSMPPEIKQNKILRSHWANVKFWAFVVDDCYGAPLVGLVPALGDAAAGAILLVVTFYYYNGFMNALDRQIRLDYANDPQMLKEYERIKRKHNKGILIALFKKVTIGTIPFVGDYRAAQKYRPASRASRNIGKVVIEFYGYKGDEKHGFLHMHLRLPRRPGRAKQKEYSNTNQPTYSKSQRSAGRSTKSSKKSKRRRKR